MDHVKLELASVIMSEFSPTTNIPLLVRFQLVRSPVKYGLQTVLNQNSSENEQKRGL